MAWTQQNTLFHVGLGFRVWFAGAHIMFWVRIWPKEHKCTTHCRRCCAVAFVLAKICLLQRPLKNANRVATRGSANGRLSFNYKIAHLVPLKPWADKKLLKFVTAQDSLCWVWRETERFFKDWLGSGTSTPDKKWDTLHGGSIISKSAHQTTLSGSRKGIVCLEGVKWDWSVLN